MCPPFAGNHESRNGDQKSSRRLPGYLDHGIRDHLRGNACPKPPNAVWEKPKLATNTSTLKITHQDGHRFWGVRNTNDEGSQPFIAIVDPSESSIIAVGPSGSIRGKVLNKNAFTYCYSQIPTKQSELAYVECTLAKRQR
jgi:hypothetical protein